MDPAPFMRNLLSMFRYWQYEVMRPFANYSKRVNPAMSLDNYYLLQIVRWFDGLTMTELAQHLTTSKQQATLKVNRLCDAGYLKRLDDKNDRRLVKVVVTQKAQQELDAYYANTMGYMDVLREKLSEEDLIAVNDAMEQLLRVLPKLT